MRKNSNFTLELYYIAQKQLFLCAETTEHMGKISPSCLGIWAFQIKYRGEKYSSSIGDLEMEVLPDEAVFQLLVLKLLGHSCVDNDLILKPDLKTFPNLPTLLKVQ